MQFTLTLNTTFPYFTEWLDYEFRQIRLLNYPAEDGNEYHLKLDWKDELGAALVRAEEDIEERRRLFALCREGYVGVWVDYCRDKSSHHKTEMTTISFDIATPRPRHIQLIIDERFDELPAIVPPAIKDRLSELFRRIALRWPEAHSQLREQYPELFGEDTPDVISPETIGEPTEDGAQRTQAQPRLDTCLKVAKARLIIEEVANITKTVACQSVPVDIQTYNRWYQYEDVLRKRDELRRRFEVWKQRERRSDIREFLEGFSGF